MTTNEQIVIMGAFRYALGRMTYAVGAVVDYIHEHWNDIPNDLKELMCREIKEYRERYGKAGMDMDDRDWETIISRFHLGIIEYERHR